MALSEKALRAYLGDDGEEIVFQTRQHPIVIVGAILRILLAVLVAAAAAWGVQRVGFLDNDAGLWLQRAVYLLALLYALKALWHIIAWNAERLLISTHKVLHVEGIFNRRVSSTPLVKVDELTVVQPFIGRMLNYGRLMVAGAAEGEQPLHGLGFIPDPGDVYRMITDNARSQRLVEGGAIADHPSVAARPHTADPTVAPDTTIDADGV
jgi:uncharacterized membrane protein YdbT with pleckstrin-like domain